MDRMPGWGKLVCACAALAGAWPAAAQLPAEYVTPPVITVPSLPEGGAATPPVPARPAARAPSFAPDAALGLARLSPTERDERYFLRTASTLRRFEADASQLALTQSNSPAVRAYATGVLKEQAASGVALQRLLNERGMALPMLDNPDRKVLNRLVRLRGPKFDREYLALMSQRLARGHIPLHERSAATADDPELRSWIDQRLPALRQRLAAADRLLAPGTVAAQRPRPAATPRAAGSTARMGAAPQRSAKAPQRPTPAPRQRVE